MRPEGIRKVIRESYPRFCTVVLEDGRRFRTRMMYCLVTDHRMYISRTPPKRGVIVPVDQVARVLPPRLAARTRSDHRRKVAKAR